MILHEKGISERVGFELMRLITIVISAREIIDEVGPEYSAIDECRGGSRRLRIHRDAMKVKFEVA